MPQTIKTKRVHGEGSAADGRTTVPVAVSLLYVAIALTALEYFGRPEFYRAHFIDSAELHNGLYPHLWWASCSIIAYLIIPSALVLEILRDLSFRAGYEDRERDARLVAQEARQAIEEQIFNWTYTDEQRAKEEFAAKKPGEWNETRIVCQGSHIQHYLNGVKIVDCTVGSADWNARVEKSKFKAFPLFAKKRRGYILLQDHGHAFPFRRIRIREL